MTTQPEPLYQWQVLDDRDGRWGTCTMDLNGHCEVLTCRDKDIALGRYAHIAKLHFELTGQPVRLFRYVPDLEFDGPKFGEAP